MPARELQNLEAYARSVLHHDIAHGDRIGRDAEGRVVIALAIPEPEFDALVAFDPDGVPDLEPQCEDEGGQCEDEGAVEEDMCPAEDAQAARGLTPPSRYRKGPYAPAKREEQITVTGRDGWTYWATLIPDGELLYGEPIGEFQAVA